MASFTGEHENRIDKKGRVSIPAPFRSILGAPDNNVVFSKPPSRALSLDGAGMDWLDRLQDRLDKLEDQPDQLLEDSSEFVRLQLYFADMVQLGFDSEGRVMLPRKLLDHAEIDETVMFIGTGRTFQLWAPPNYALFRQQDNEARIQRRQKQLAAAAGGAA